MRSLTSSLVLAAALLMAAAAVPAPAAAQTAWVAGWLREYADPATRGAVVDRMPSIIDLARLQADLERLLDPWLKEEGADETRQRRVIAAFALEAAAARLGVGGTAVELTEWACRQIRRLREPGDFERRWHLAAFAVFGGAVDADGLEAHAGHMRLQFRDEPRLFLERAVAEELRAAPFSAVQADGSFERDGAPGGAVGRHLEQARIRYRNAAEIEETRGEATVRLAHVLLALARPEEALEAVDSVIDTLDDTDLQYLAHLFRGQALERLGRTDEARTAFGRALGVVPRAQSASMALAALLFREGQRGIADQIVAELLGRSEQPDDPWWNYWPGDYRNLKPLMAAMREALQ